MKTLLLSLGLVAVLASPVAAQSGYDESAANIAAGGNSGVAAPGSSNDFVDGSVDETTTGSIAVVPRDRAINPSLCEHGAGIDPASDPQCEFYGANSR